LLNNYAPLISHYLNVASEHGYWKEAEDKRYRARMEKLKGFTYNDVSDRPSAATLADAHNTIKTIMFAEALAGGQATKTAGGYGRNAQAELLVVNNSNVGGTGKGAYSVYWVDDLVNAAIAEHSLVSLVHRDSNGYTEDKYDGFIRDNEVYQIGGDWRGMDRKGK
jgi:hypothetical protein